MVVERKHSLGIHRYYHESTWKTGVDLVRLLILLVMLQLMVFLAGFPCTYVWVGVVGNGLRNEFLTCSRS
jgi:hypothetical protein